MGNYSRLLSWHAAHVRSMGHLEFAAHILRTRSTALHDVLAYIATDDRFTVTELRDIVLAGDLKSTEPRIIWLAALGRVVALQALEDGDSVIGSRDLEFGLACLSFANQSLPRNQEHQQFHRLEIELLMMLGHVAQARHLLDNNEFLRGYYYSYLLSELDHPTYSKNTTTLEHWAEGFNRPFEANGLEKIDGHSLLQHNYNELKTGKVRVRDHGSKVSVIMTSYRPDRDSFFTAVNSILNQSWLNLELIIVDDASPNEFTEVLTQAESLDPRVRLIQLANNGGTYQARNAGIAAATGEFMTGQDSDDWSHPERIATQVDYLLANPSAKGVVVEAIRVDDALRRTFPGRIPYGNCEVSFMLPTSLARKVGGYMRARKGADGEFRRRIEKYTGAKVHAIEKPLYLIRMGHESLSKADFKPGWSHPVRRTFWSSTRHWHENTDLNGMRLRDDAQPIPIPHRFQVNPPGEPPHYDVIYVGDWRAYTGTQRTMIDEIVTLTKRGNKVGILHLESLMSPSKETTRLCFEVQSMVNAHQIDVVVQDDGASTDVAVIHDPTILQFTPTKGVNLTANVLVIRPDFPPPAADKAVIYLPDECDHKARKLFGNRVIWAASDPAVRRYLAYYRPEIELHESLYPIALRPQQWYNTRTRLHGEDPVIGRHSENYEAHWPQSLSECSEVWPINTSHEIRVLGDARSFLRRYARRSFPVNWVVYRDSEIQPEAFMSSIDFFVYFPAADYPQEFSREALEAAASGAVVILPHSFRKLHGGTAIYASAEVVKELISQYATRPTKFHQRVYETYQRLQETPFELKFLDYFEGLQQITEPSSAYITEFDA